MAQRYASFAFEPDDGPSFEPPSADDEVASARDLVLRVARMIADPVDYRLLSASGRGMLRWSSWPIWSICPGWRCGSG